MDFHFILIDEINNQIFKKIEDIYSKYKFKYTLEHYKNISKIDSLILYEEPEKKKDK